MSPSATCTATRRTMSLYRFDDYQLDPQARRLFHGGSDVAVEPRVLELIAYLIEHRQRAVGRDELIAGVWGRVDSSDATLAQAILKARRVLGDDGSAQRMIRTVPRFGYQWVMATDAIAIEMPRPYEPLLRTSDVAPSPAVDDATRFIEIAAPQTSSRRSLAIGAALMLLLSIVAGSVWLARGDFPTSQWATGDAAHRVVPGLILVAPATVHSALVQDGWMRLGLMAMSADALRTLPNHSLVPNESSLMLGEQAVQTADVARLRAATGAATVILIDAHHADERWRLEALLLGADGRRESVDAEDGDAIAAAAALSERLRGALGGSDGEAGDPPEVLALAARMQAAILEGHADRAIAVAEAASGNAATAPTIELLNAKAMNRLGRADDAIALLRALVQRAGSSVPAWLAPAWTTLGYSELLRGDPTAGEQAFQRGIAAAGADRTETGRAWRGLGNAQSAAGATAEAESSFLRARLELGDDGDALLLAHIEDDLGSVAARRGRYAEAISHYRQAVAAAGRLGASELELGAHMNIALAQHEQLQHAAALATWRDLMPRFRTFDYPAMQRYAAVHYADALLEAGAVTEARHQLEAAASLANEGSPDAIDEAGLDRLRVQLALGEIEPVRDTARSLTSSTHSSRTRLLAFSLLIRADLADGVGAATPSDTTLLPVADAADDASARAQALTALAGLQARLAATDAADATYRQALAAVRETASPRELREIAVPYANFLLDRGRLDEARTTAALIQPYGDEDFGITLLLARLASDRDPALSRSLRARARTLAGSRPLPPDAAPAIAAVHTQPTPAR